MQNNIAWRPEPELNSPDGSTRWAGLTMDIDARPANESQGECLTNKRRRCWFIPDEAELARRQQAKADEEAAWLAEMNAAPLNWGLCYFIGCDEGMVKIGWSKDVNRRLAELKGPSIYKLRVLATARGGKEREAHYHTKFAAHALGNEWFQRCPEIEAEIARLNGGAA